MENTVTIDLEKYNQMRDGINILNKKITELNDNRDKIKISLFHYYYGQNFNNSNEYKLDISLEPSSYDDIKLKKALKIFGIRPGNFTDDKTIETKIKKAEINAVEKYKQSLQNKWWKFW